MLARLKIGPKLLLAPGVVLVLLVLLSSGAFYAMVHQNASLETIVQQRALHMRSADELVVTAQKAHASIYRLLSWISGSFPRARTEPLIRDIYNQHDAIDRSFIALANLTATSSGERRYVEQAAAAQKLYHRAVLDVIEIAAHDSSISANAMQKAEAAFVVVAQRLTELSRLEQQLSEDASESAAADFRLIAVLMPVVIVLSILLSLLITMAVRRSLLAEIRSIDAAAIDLASGDLTIKEREYGSDEIAQTSRALDASIRNLNGTLRTILESARSIGSASREITLGNANLHTRPGVRASLEQTASSMQELAATINLAADGAQVANQLAESASTVAQRGSNVVDRLASTLDSVKNRSQRVVEIVGMIDSFANQASTLALNAAVEAARAGEDGREFATTATEVRSLARRASLAAREVRELAAEAVAEIEDGTAWAAEAGSSIAHLADSVQQVGSIVNRISCASAEQASGISEVSQAIVQMDEMTQQNSQLVEEAAAAARSLQQQALTLSRAVAAFRLDEAVQAPVELAAATPRPKRGRRATDHPYLRLASSRD
ncbi:methyl-accepting chemotaxis protein [Massilia horti]|uniref:HAMP domain-containing protein n=1 Tax=Massilia horti TaxID=2562153 RepID=A0A4Y9T201_9BURK|nr:methyl-accepting chemotaxis protein [Massilia horti]TFW33020.1 HAMP domain-containing protein [Massilia horti]